MENWLGKKEDRKKEDRKGRRQGEVEEGKERRLGVGQEGKTGMADVK